jgi:predicted HTH transcriptional regulator
MQKKINVRFSPFSTSQNKDVSCTSLVRFENTLNNRCFHIHLTEKGDVDVFVADPSLSVLDIENAAVVTQQDVVSVDFHDALSSNGGLSKTEKALAIVKEFPYRTSQEMASKVNPAIISADSLHKRLSDLAKKNLVRKVEMRGCTITGKIASTWAPVEA